MSVKTKVIILSMATASLIFYQNCSQNFESSTVKSAQAYCLLGFRSRCRRWLVFYKLLSGGLVSSDQGMTWQKLSPSPSAGFHHPMVERLSENRLAMIGLSTGTNILGISLDGGLSWSTPPTLQVPWLKAIKEGNGRMVALGYLAPTSGTPVSYSAVSLDQGKTWTIQQHSEFSANWANLLFTGTQFIAWSSGKRWHSNDGVTWASSNVMIGTTPSAFGGPTAYNPTTKTFARILGGWGNNYARQKAYRSLDGIIWHELSSTAFKGGHPIRKMINAQMDTAYCPVTGL